MNLMKQLNKRVRNISGYAKICVKMGAIMMLCFYIAGAVAYILAPQAPNYFGAIGAFRACMEAAPASLASGICAAVICDLLAAPRKSDENDEE